MIGRPRLSAYVFRSSVSCLTVKTLAMTPSNVNGFGVCSSEVWKVDVGWWVLADVYHGDGCPKQRQSQAPKSQRRELPNATPAA